MKNIFKFMGIAMIAGSLMVACGKEENEDPENNTDTTATTDTTPIDNPQTNVVTATWGGQPLTVGYSYGMFATSQGLRMHLFMAAEGINNGEPVGTWFTHYFVENQGRINSVVELETQQGVWLADMFPCDVFENGAGYEEYEETADGEDTIYRGTHRVLGVTRETEYSNVDLNTHTFSCNLGLYYYDVAAWYAAVAELDRTGMSENQYNDACDALKEQVAAKELILKLENYTFRQMQL